MDADGTCLVVSPCNQCKINKNGVQSCITRKHNARLTAVKRKDLASRHRQCVKPDQTMTIFKLVDRDSGEESVEFAPDMVFQRSCSSCAHLKTCILGGHELTDWVPEEGRGRIQQNKRKSGSSDTTDMPPIAPEQQPSNKARKVSGGTNPSITIPGPALKAAAAAMAAATALPYPAPKGEGGAASKAEGRPKRRSSKGRRASAPEACEQAPPCPAAAAAAAAAPSAADPNAAESAAGTNAEAGLVDDTGDGGASAAPPQSIASQLDALAAQEDLLLQHYQADMQRFDEAKASRESEILVARDELESIKATREATKSMVADQRKNLVAERDRLTRLRCQEVIREEAEHRQKKNVLWSAVEPTAVAEVTGANDSGSGDASETITTQLSLAVHTGLGVVARPSPATAASREAETSAVLTALSQPLSVSSQLGGSSPPPSPSTTQLGSGNEKLAAGAGGMGSGSGGGEQLLVGHREGSPNSWRLRGGEEAINGVRTPEANGVPVRGDIQAAEIAPSPAMEDGEEPRSSVAEEETAVKGRGEDADGHESCHANAGAVGLGGSNGTDVTAKGEGVVEEDEGASSASVGATPTKPVDAPEVDVVEAAAPAGVSALQQESTAQEEGADSSMEVDEIEEEGEEEGEEEEEQQQQKE
ncbi:unnamed protein product, partial [Pylaiella littoralis]